MKLLVREQFVQTSIQSMEVCGEHGTVQHMKARAEVLINWALHPASTWGIAATAPPFLTLTLAGGLYSASHPGHFMSR
jgi:hypothetical protein